jgi:hypothetical protein
MYSWPGDPGKNVRGVPRLEGNPLCFCGSEEEETGAKAVFHLFVRTQTKGLCSSFPGRLRANARKKQAKKQKQMKKHDQYADISSFS